MTLKTKPTFDQLKDRIAQRISENRVSEGPGNLGRLTIRLSSNVTRTFRAHWTGYRLAYPDEVIVMMAEMNDGSFYSEAYISLTQASFVLAFRSKPPAVRGTGGPRPDDKFASEQSVQIALEHRRKTIEMGDIRDEEIIRYEDFDDPAEAVDAFFNYTNFYCLKSISAEWADVGYEADPSVGWTKDEISLATVPIDAAIDEGLKRSDIIWLTVDTDKSQRPTPCWFVYTKDKRLFVLSGEREQRLPGGDKIRNARVVTRWKGRDARMSEFDASVRVITPADRDEYFEIGELLVNKRQSATGTATENIERWMKQGVVILELTPRS